VRYAIGYFNGRIRCIRNIPLKYPIVYLS
jgi:hypothetical protein